MKTCPNCYTVAETTYCPNCGTLMNANAQPSAQPYVNAPVVHENAIVKGRYNAGVLLLAGYLGLVFLIVFVAMLVYMVLGIGEGISVGDFFALAGSSLLCLGMFLLCCLPGILMIRKRSPKGTAVKTFISFLIKSVFFLIGWCVTLVACCFIMGLILRAWRIGLAVSKPKDTEYTAFVDGEKIAVTRLIDKEYSTIDQIRYIYVDQNGEFYRPALR